jgi:hypothetical protein
MRVNSPVTFSNENDLSRSPTTLAATEIRLRRRYRHATDEMATCVIEAIEVRLRIALEMAEGQ